MDNPERTLETDVRAKSSAFKLPAAPPLQRRDLDNLYGPVRRSAEAWREPLRDRAPSPAFVAVFERLRGLAHPQHDPRPSRWLAAATTFPSARPLSVVLRAQTSDALGGLAAVIGSRSWGPGSRLAVVLRRGVVYSAAATVRFCFALAVHAPSEVALLCEPADGAEAAAEQARVSLAAVVCEVFQAAAATTTSISVADIPLGNDDATTIAFFLGLSVTDGTQIGRGTLEHVAFHRCGLGRHGVVAVFNSLWCGKGSLGSRVSRVEVSGEAMGHYALRALAAAALRFRFATWGLPVDDGNLAALVPSRTDTVPDDEWFEKTVPLFNGPSSVAPARSKLILALSLAACTELDTEFFKAFASCLPPRVAALRLTGAPLGQAQQAALSKQLQSAGELQLDLAEPTAAAAALATRAAAAAFAFPVHNARDGRALAAVAAAASRDGAALQIAGTPVLEGVAFRCLANVPKLQLEEGDRGFFLPLRALVEAEAEAQAQAAAAAAAVRSRDLALRTPKELRQDPSEDLATLLQRGQVRTLAVSAGQVRRGCLQALARGLKASFDSGRGPRVVSLRVSQRCEPAACLQLLDALAVPNDRLADLRLELTWRAPSELRRHEAALLRAVRGSSRGLKALTFVSECLTPALLARTIRAAAAAPQLDACVLGRPGGLTLADVTEALGLLRGMGPIERQRGSGRVVVQLVCAAEAFAEAEAQAHRDAAAAVAQLPFSALMFGIELVPTRSSPCFVQGPAPSDWVRPSSGDGCSGTSDGGGHTDSVWRAPPGALFEALQLRNALVAVAAEQHPAVLAAAAAAAAAGSSRDDGDGTS